MVFPPWPRMDGMFIDRVTVCWHKPSAAVYTAGGGRKRVNKYSASVTLDSHPSLVPTSPVGGLKDVWQGSSPHASCSHVGRGERGTLSQYLLKDTEKQSQREIDQFTYIHPWNNRPHRVLQTKTEHDRMGKKIMKIHFSSLRVPHSLHPNVWLL